MMHGQKNIKLSVLNWKLCLQ